MGLFTRAPKYRPAIRSAAGQVVKGGSPAGPEAILRRREDWQNRVIAYADSVPEVAATSAFVNAALSRVHFEVEGAGSDELNEVVEENIRHLPTGRIAENLYLVGEVMTLFWYDNAAKTTRWESLGFNDWKVKQGAVEVKQENGRDYAPLPAGYGAWRTYRPDRSDRYKAWSAHKSMLELLEAMYLHQLADTAIATSRLAGAGILYVPNDGMISIPVPDGGVPEPGTEEELRQHLTDAMLDSVRSRSGADAIVPIVLFGEAEFSKGLRHMVMERADDAAAFSSRMKAYRERYATGADLPAEIVTGMGSANHWSAWKVDQNTWKYYLEPLANLIANSLRESGYIAALGEALGFDPSKVTIVPDGSKVVAKPDRTDAAIRLKQLGVITDLAAATAAGFSEEDLDPTEYDPTSARRLEELPAEYRDSGSPLVSSIPLAATFASHEMQLLKKLNSAWRIYRNRDFEGAAEPVSKVVASFVEDEIRSGVHGATPDIDDLDRRVGVAVDEFIAGLRASSESRTIPDFIVQSVVDATRVKSV